MRAYTPTQFGFSRAHPGLDKVAQDDRGGDEPGICVQSGRNRPRSQYPAPAFTDASLSQLWCIIPTIDAADLLATVHLLSYTGSMDSTPIDSPDITPYLPL